MHQRKYFTSNFFINEIFSVEKFPNYGIYINNIKTLSTTLIVMHTLDMNDMECI